MPTIPTGAFVALGVLMALGVVVLLFKSMWKVAEPNEALIITGLGARGVNQAGESLGFKIVAAKGTIVIPGLQTVRRLSLRLQDTPLEIDDPVTKQKIRVGVKAVAIFKVGDDFTSIANAARRFLDQRSEEMVKQVHSVLTGHLRAIVGGMTVEEMIGDRERLNQETRTASSNDMQKLGLVIDSFQIQEIKDTTGYIANLGKPQAAEVAAQARIAEAEKDREATQREQEAQARMAEARRTSEVERAGYQAQVDEAKAKSSQAGPLAEAKARQEVVTTETETARLEAAREERRLESTVRKPADARAYEQRTIADAARDARIAQANGEAESTKVNGQAEADAAKARGLAAAEATKAQGLAEAAAIQARAQALAENQDAVINQQVAERLPEIVAAVAAPLSNVDQMVMLNGAQDLTGIFTQVLSQVGAVMPVAKSLFNGGSNGSSTKVETLDLTKEEAN